MGKWVVYANNGKSTYQIKGKRFDSEVDAYIFAGDYQTVYGEVTFPVYIPDRKAKVKNEGR
jgi:hypothetical protein